MRSGATGPRSVAEHVPAAAWRPVVYAVLAGAVLVAAAALWPRLTGVNVYAARAGGVAPLRAEWSPRVGIGTVPALALGAALLIIGPSLAARLPWRRLVLLTWVTTCAWTLSLALVDGRDGIASVFARQSEYVYDATRVTSVPAMLSDFVSRIPLDAAGHWQTHVAGHPAGALLTFVGLDRIGISGAFSVGLVVLVVGSTATIAGLVAVRALAGEQWARRVAPFWAAAPAAVWMGVSADALYTAVAAWGLAALALAATRPRHRIPYALLSGVLLGYCVYLSYGLVLLAILALAVLVAARTAAPVAWVLVGALAVVAAFTIAGFSWWDAYPVLVDRYYAGLAELRPFSYWAWANVACATAAGGLAVWAGLPAMADSLRRGRDAGARAIALLGSAAVLTMLVATVSAMSKAEVERIWLPFIWWALCLPALLPGSQRRLLVGLQVLTGLLLAHLLAPEW